MADSATRPEGGVRQRSAECRELAVPAVIPRTGLNRTADVAALMREAATGLPAGLREMLASKPAPWLVKAHDVGAPTDYDRDIPWHSLEKEIDPRFNLPHLGKLGLVNTHTDVNFLIGLGVGDGAVDSNPKRRFTDHLVNLIVQEVSLDGVDVHVAFVPVTSDTVLAAIVMKSTAGDERRVTVESICTKPGDEDRPVDRYGYGITPTTGGLRWIGFNAAHGAIVSSFDEWGPPQKPAIVGALLCTMLGSERPAGHRTSLADDPASARNTGETQVPHGGGREAVLRFRVDLPANGSRTLLVSLNLHRYGPRRYETPNNIVLYPQERPEEALAYSIRSAVEALGADWPALARESCKWYERVPVFHLPERTWAADLACALELPRGNTWSAQDAMKQPFYSLCRVHGHEPYGWWSYGMHGHEHLTTFVVSLTEPGLSQSFLRGHLQVQREDGFIQYGVNHRGANAQHEQKLATCPFLMWEAWGAYAWGGDRKFLEEAYAAGARYVRWWRSAARTRGGVGLQHWHDFIETVRDDADLATWAAADKAERQEALDLNCYLLNEERVLAAMARELGRPDEEKAWDTDADRRAGLMREKLWHAEDRVYYGRDLMGDRWARVMDISTFFPLWSGLATDGQAARVVELLHDPQAFGTDYPVATLAVKHMPEKRKGEYHWRGANWVEMTWLAALGLKRYGYYEEAARVAEANCRMVFRTLERTGHFREFYNSLTGEPTDLTDYLWTSMLAAMAVDVFFGVRPTAAGLEVMPALPKGWNEISVENLHMRGARLSVRVRRDAGVSRTAASVNGESRPVVEGRGVFIGWKDLPRECRVEVVQPERIPERHGPRGSER